MAPIYVAFPALVVVCRHTDKADALPDATAAAAAPQMSLPRVNFGAFAAAQAAIPKHGVDLLRAHSGGRELPSHVSKPQPLTAAEKCAAISAGIDAVAAKGTKGEMFVNMRFCGLGDDVVPHMCDELRKHTTRPVKVSLSNNRFTDEGCALFLALIRDSPTIEMIEVDDPSTGVPPGVSKLMVVRLETAGKANEAARRKREDIEWEDELAKKRAQLATLAGWRWVEPAPIFAFRYCPDGTRLGTPDWQLPRRCGVSAMGVPEIKAALKAADPKAKVSGKRDELFARLQSLRPEAARDKYNLVAHGYKEAKEGETYDAVKRLLAASPRRLDWADLLRAEFETALELEYCLPGPRDDPALPPWVMTCSGRRLLLNYARHLAEQIEGGRALGAYGDPREWSELAQLPESLLWFRRAELAFERTGFCVEAQLTTRQECLALVQRHLDAWLAKQQRQQVLGGGASPSSAASTATPTAAAGTSGVMPPPQPAASAASAEASSSVAAVSAPGHDSKAATIAPTAPSPPLTTGTVGTKKRTIDCFFKPKA